MSRWIVKRLSSGYWHAKRPSGEQFVQWPIGWAPQEEHGFHLNAGDIEDLVAWLVSDEGRAVCGSAHEAMVNATVNAPGGSNLTPPVSD